MSIHKSKYSQPGEDRIHSNSEKHPCSVKLSSKMDGYTSQANLDAVNALAEKLAKLEKAYLKWVSTEAEAEIIRRRQALIDDPTDEAIQHQASESPDELRKRYEQTAYEIRQAIEQVKRKHQGLLREILNDFLHAIEAEMDTVCAANREQAASYGIEYNVNKDAVLKSLARLSENARARLENKNALLDPQNIQLFVGNLRPKGSIAFRVASALGLNAA